MSSHPDLVSFVASIRARIDENKAKIEALSGAIKADESLVASLSHLVSAPNSRPDIQVSDEPLGVELDDSEGFPKGFRSILRKLIEKSDEPVTVAHVTASLKNMGYPDSSKTALQVRVGNELHKLAKVGEIKNVGRGLYAHSAYKS